MASVLKPYGATKYSGADWLGDVPEHWDLRRTKTLLRQRNEKGYPNEPLLAATQTKGVVRKEHYENRTVLAMKDLHLLKLVRAGDFVISLRSFQGGIEYARERGIISPAYTILFPAQAENHAYIAHLFKSAPYVENLTLFVTGIRQGQNIDYAKLGRSRLPLPPLREQRAIVRFLDHADRRIQRYIRARERLIELLEERKRVLIHEAVTGRIDVRTGQSYLAYKDSGLEWLGQVPEHWRMIRAKGLFDKVERPVRLHDKVVTCFRDGVVTLRENRRVLGFTESLKEIGYQGVRRGDLVIHAMDAFAGACGVSDSDGKSTPVYAVCTPSGNGVNAHYYAFCVREMARSQWILALSRGVRKRSTDFRFAAFGSQLVPVPPYSEQSAIVRHLERRKTTLEAAVEGARQQCDLLREYRTRLIADVVTGKLDAREAASSLSETDPLTADDPSDNRETQDWGQGDTPNPGHPHP